MSASQRKCLQARKDLLFSDLTSLHDYFKGAKNRNILNVKAKYLRLNSLATTFEELVAEILAYNAGVDTAEGISLKDRETYIELIDAIRSYYFRVEKAAEEAAKRAEATDQRVSAPQLPKIQLKQFDGAIEQWMDFITIFDTLVHNNSNISDEQKFHYLKTSLKGEAAATIAAFALEKDNYKLAYQTLSKRYQSPRRLGNYYLQLILKYRAQVVNPQKFLNIHESAISALKTLKLTDLTEYLLFQLSYNNLDSETQQAFDLHFGNTETIPTTADLLNYVRLLAKTDELKKDVSLKTTSGWQNPRSHFSEVKDKARKPCSKPQCCYCQQEHFLSYCPAFKKKSLEERRRFVAANNLCGNCLGAHTLQNCWSKKTCILCQQKHHSLLHPGLEIACLPKREEKVSTHLTNQIKAALLSTATLVIESDGLRQTARALIDAGSEASFISESLVQRLRLKRTPSSTIVSGVGATACAVTKGCVNLHFRARHDERVSFHTEALILPKLTDYLPPKIKGFSTDEISQLELADEDVLSNHPVEVILGVEIYALIVKEGIRRVSENEILLQNTSLGWILCGTLTSDKKPQITVHCSTLDKKLLKNLERFWQMEEPTSLINSEDLNCEKHFQKTCRRNPEGRFVVQLPFQEEPSKLGESRSAAYRSLSYCEKKLSRNPELSKLYHDFLQEYLELGHMEKVEDVPSLHYFLPHHAVLRPSSTTTKLRVVFNASKPTSSGKSLNDLLHIGPQLLPNVQDLFLRWRKYRIVFSADIEKMYRQILVDDKDQFFQLILWENKVYRLKTVTYGTACAPYLAIRVLRKLAEDEDLPLGKEIIDEEVYMDDVLSGGRDECEALEKQKQLIELLRRGGFVLRKWTSNNPLLLKHLPEHLKARSSERECFPTETHSMLGIKWQRDSDTIVIDSKLDNLPETVTKRKILSEIARLFDPLGYAAPLLIKSKIFLQSLWLCKLSWDDTLPEELAHQWRNLHQELASIHLTIPRWISFANDAEFIEIHGFSDASEKAVAAVVYICFRFNGLKRISLLGSKTKVAPLKQISLPRLELTAAVLLTRLIRQLTRALALPRIDHVHLWTASTITLFWVRNHPGRWTTFVGNRVSEIQTSAPQANWAYVPSEENPADCATRGVTNKELTKFQRWWCGPPWLSLEPDSWPRQPILTFTEPAEERKRQKLLMCHSTILSDWMENYSSYHRLVRITAYCLRYVNKLKRNSKERGPLTVSEIWDARRRLIKEVQAVVFSEEIRSLKNNKTVPRNSCLIKLNRFLDEDDLLRVGGRLSHSLLGHNQKHPIILPQKHPFSILVVREAHSRTLHGGTQLTLATARQEYWILRGRQTVKSIIKECITCKRFQGSLLYQQMGNLPKERIQPSRPFLHSGVDYAGPVQLRTSKGRGQKSYKGYIAVFVCFFSRAVHLEVVSDYTAEGFLATYRRFTSRRGNCASITSDRGTNFVGAATLLKGLFDQNSSSGQKIADQLAKDRTKWKFNAPAAPHFGGLWEAGVKSVKHHLKRVIGDSKLTFEELTTLLCQIEAILNSRPLQPLSDDVDDFEPLTPGHFLLGEPLTTLPEKSPEVDPASITSRWRLIQNQRLSFWRRWSSEYIQQLQRRNKWEYPNREISVGDLVLIKQDNTSPGTWPLARILQLHRGPDGLVRVVTLKTAKSEGIQRPIVKLCPLLKVTQPQPAANT